MNCGYHLRITPITKEIVFILFQGALLKKIFERKRTQTYVRIENFFSSAIWNKRKQLLSELGSYCL